MIQIKEIQKSFQHIVGWEQSYNLKEQISDELTISESGLTFQSQHPLLTLKNIRSIMPLDYAEMKYAEWNDKKQYEIAEKVKHANNIFIAKSENIAQEPNSDSAYWDIFNPLSDFITERQNTAIANFVTNFITKKLLSKETRNIFENRILFDGAGRLAATIQNTGKIVGYEITPLRSIGVTAKINKIGLQTAGGSGIIRVYIFHSNNKNPLKTIDLNVTGQNGYQWFDVAKEEIYLPYNSLEKNAGGSYYIVYNQNELPQGIEAINMSKDFSKSPCQSCGSVSNIRDWHELMQYSEIHPIRIKAPADFKEYPEMWDVEDNIYTNTTNYGLNLEITLGCDLTDFFISQRSIFANVVAKQVAANMLREIALNPEVNVNRNQLNVSRMDMMYELDGNTNSINPKGLGAELEKAYKSVELDTKGIDVMCLGCHKNGVTYGAV